MARMSAAAMARRILKNKGGNFVDARVFVNGKLASNTDNTERYWIAVLATINEAADEWRKANDMTPRAVYTAEPGRWIARNGVSLFYIGIDSLRANWDNFGPTEADAIVRKIVDMLNAAE